MPRSARRASQSNAEKARAAKARAAGRTLQQQAASPFVFIALISGLGFRAIEMMMWFLGVPVPSESTFCAAQHELIDRLVEFAHLSCAMPAQLVRDIAVLALDGSWSHVRWSGQCFGLFIDLLQRKISVGWDIVELFDKNHAMLGWASVYRKYEWIQPDKPSRCWPSTRR
jgi:hypothetical protein